MNETFIDHRKSRRFDTVYCEYYFTCKLLLLTAKYSESTIINSTVFCCQVILLILLLITNASIYCNVYQTLMKIINLIITRKDVYKRQT